MDQEHSKQTPRDFCDSDGMCTSSLKEISLIETVTSFLEENGAAEVDPRVLKNLAEALSKRIGTDDTSPSGLHDVTMENSYTSFDAARAPGGIHSPMQGRSVRELEEQMSTLRKENFNLKLRIYFMEEGQHGARGAKNAADSPSKQLIDSKIEIEILRKRVEEKTELLKDAARAISQHEDMQKKADMESQTMIEQMQQYIHQLEAAAKQKATKKSMDAFNAEKFKTLEAEVLKLENALLEADLRETESRQQQELLANDLADRQETLVACEAKIEELAIKNAGLLEQLEKQAEIDQLANQTIKRQKVELSACLTENGRLLSELNATEHEMQCQNKWIGDAVTVLDVQRKTIRVMEDMNNEKDRAHRQLFIRLNEYENVIRRQSFEVDMVRRKKQFFQDLSQKLQYKDRLHCLERIAIVQPKFRDLPSSCSYRNNFSAISILFAHPDLSSARQVRKLYFSMPEPNADLRTQLADKSCELQDAEEKLAERERVHEQACRTIQKLMQKLNSQEKEINKLKQQTKSSEVSQTSPSKHSLSDTENCSVDISRSLKQRYERQISDQDELIKQLQADVKKKTANLQNLVNKELWEKNREVERLTKLVSTQHAVDVSGDDSIGELQQSFTEADYAKAVKRNKLLQRKVDVLLHRLDEVQQSSSLATQLRQELHDMQTDVENANKWRLECADVCSVLTNRLEELAGFLNSLLKHKDVLGVLAADRRHAMRRAIDRSLDLSKSLNMTLSITGVSLADQSLAQLSKLSEILYNEADERNHTYNSHEDLQAANKALKSDGQPQRKERRSLPLPQQQQQLDNQSESEAWSEPDRKVSLARIGLEDTSNSMMAGEQQLSESDSEGRHGCSAGTLKQDRSRQTERINQLEALIAQRDERVLHVQCQLVDADNRFKQEQLRVLELSQQLEQLRAQNDTLQADLRAIGTQDDREMAELQHQIELKTQQLEQLQLAHQTLQADAQIAELELQEAQKKMQYMEQQHTVGLNEAHEELAQFQLAAAEQQRLQQERLARDWIAVYKYEELKSQLLEAQRSLDFYQESEKELKQTLVENELAARALKKELDESTLHASKAIMERTKAYNDKLQLERRLEELKLQLVQLQEEQRLHQCPPPPPPQRSDVSQSGYTSEEVPQRATAGGRRVNNPSPDLGIESDTGRVLSVELSNAQRTLLKTVELAEQQADLMDEKDDILLDAEAAAPTASAIHDCAKVEQENADLRRKLTRTKRAFEDTYEKLRVVNKAKAQVEKDIKNQILKTHNVLRNVRSNMENVL